MRKISGILFILSILVIVGCSQGLTNKQQLKIYDSHLRNCIDSQEYKNWEDTCQNAEDEYYLENCFGKNYCEEKLRGLIEELKNG